MLFRRPVMNAVETEETELLDYGINCQGISRNLEGKDILFK